MKTLAFLVGVALLCAAPFSLQWSSDKGISLSPDFANAVIGRPLTPRSVAGVHRRAHRRAYYYHHQPFYHRVYYHGHYYYR